MGNINVIVLVSIQFFLTKKFSNRDNLIHLEIVGTQCCNNGTFHLFLEKKKKWIKSQNIMELLLLIFSFNNSSVERWMHHCVMKRLWITKHYGFMKHGMLDLSVVSSNRRLLKAIFCHIQFQERKVHISLNNLSGF